MKMTKAAAYGIGACAAACAGVSVLPLIAGAGIAGSLGIGAAFAGWSAEAAFCAAVLAAIAGGLAVTYRRIRSDRSTEAENCATDGTCGCAPDRRQGNL